ARPPLFRTAHSYKTPPSQNHRRYEAVDFVASVADGNAQRHDLPTARDWYQHQAVADFKNPLRAEVGQTHHLVADLRFAGFPAHQTDDAGSAPAKQEIVPVQILQ